MKMKHTVSIILSVVALTLSACVSEDMLETKTPSSSKDSIEAGSTIDTMIPSEANILEVNVTVKASGFGTKAGLSGSIADTAAVEVLSFHPGENPGMPEVFSGIPGQSSQSTKAIYSQNTTRQLNSNFLRLDEVINEDGSATYSWPNWGKAKLLEAEVISSPDHTDGLFYRSITFTPTQAYNIRTYNDDKDTIFYHSRMVAWHPMILTVPRDGDKAAAVEFSNSRYANNRYNVSANEFGVVFDHTLDGSVDLMMSNMVEGQRWHPKFNPSKPETRDRDGYNWKHYADKEQTQEEISYRMPFGHNESKPEYANPVFFHHYLSAVRLWAIVENDGESLPLNLKTWGEIENVSFIDQPATAIIGIPEKVSSALNLQENGKLEKNAQGQYVMNLLNLEWGKVISWGDATNLNIHGDRMFGNDSNTLGEDFTVDYPVDMTKDGGVKLDKTYLGYCLVKPFTDSERSKTNGINIAIQTSAGIYYATIPSIATYKDEGGNEHEIEMFKESQIYDIVLNLRTEGSINEFIEHENDVNYINLSPYDEIDNTGYMSANCYVIDINELTSRIADYESSGPAGYCFTGSVMGNGERGVLSDGNVSFPTNDAIIRGASSAKVVWQSELDLITNVQLQHEYVRFIVNKAQEGNAVIAVTDNTGKILWSWHIWITEDPTKNPVELTIVKAHDDLPAVKTTMLDRNLGALSNSASSTSDFSSYGLYYQWGRKDPLPGPSEINTFTSSIAPVYDGFSEEITNLVANSFGNGIEASIQSPMNYMYSDDSPYYQYNWMQRPIDFLWGQNTGGKIQKSIYDPCPFGYRVPFEELQNLLENSVVSAHPGYGIEVKSEDNKTVFFPYAGFIGAERNQYSREPVFNYVSTKGDYTSGQIAPSNMVASYSYFSNHRLRSYLTDTEWTEETLDGQSPFTFVVPDGKYRVIPSNTIPRDYTNRTTAASVRCVKDESYEGKSYAVLNLQNYDDTKFVSGGEIKMQVKGGINIGSLSSTLSIQGYGSSAIGDPIRYDLSDATYDNFNVTKKTSTTIEGIFTFNVPDDFLSDGITKYRFTLSIKDKEGSITEETIFQEITFNYAHIKIIDQTTWNGSGARPLVTVADRGKNFTQKDEPLVEQPAFITVYVRKDIADIHGGTAVVSGSVSGGGSTSDIPVTFAQTPHGTMTIGNIEYYEYSAPWTNNITNSSGARQTANIHLSFSGGTTLPGAKDKADKTPEVKVWGINQPTPRNGSTLSAGCVMVASGNSSTKNQYWGFESNGTPIVSDGKFTFNNLLYFTNSAPAIGAIVVWTSENGTTVKNAYNKYAVIDNGLVQADAGTSWHFGEESNSLYTIYRYKTSWKIITGTHNYKEDNYTRLNNSNIVIGTGGVISGGQSAYHKIFSVTQIVEPGGSTKNIDFTNITF